MSRHPDRPDVEFTELMRRAQVDAAMKLALDPKAHPRLVADAEAYLATTRPLDFDRLGTGSRRGRQAS